VKVNSHRGIHKNERWLKIWGLYTILTGGEGQRDTFGEQMTSSGEEEE
jgi:hypothetical protein